MPSNVQLKIKFICINFKSTMIHGTRNRLGDVDNDCYLNGYLTINILKCFVFYRKRNQWTEFLYIQYEFFCIL